jgi:hypothetical protein
MEEEFKKPTLPLSRVSNEKKECKKDVDELEKMPVKVEFKPPIKPVPKIPAAVFKPPPVPVVAEADATNGVSSP